MTTQLLSILQWLLLAVVTFLLCRYNWLKGYLKGFERGRNQAFADILVDGRVDHGKLAEMLLDSSGNIQKAKISGVRPPEITSLNDN